VEERAKEIQELMAMISIQMNANKVKDKTALERKDHSKLKVGQS